MKQRFTHTALLVAAMILSVGLNFTAQTSNRNTKDISDPLQKDCETCQNEVGTAPDLGTAAAFAVLAGSTVTNTGPSILRGDLGVSPGTAITGFPPGIVFGITHEGTPAAAEAQADALLAYNDLSGQACDTDLTGQDLGGLVLVPGVYCFDSSAQLTGMLTLNGEGDPNAVFVFQIASTLTTASASSVVLTNGGTACNVFFQVGSSATLGMFTGFQGTIIASTSITLNTGANIFGRALALNGAVTLDTNDVTRCNFVPTAAVVNLGGRVTNANGSGISSAAITMTDGGGSVRTAYTSSFGYYNFEDVAVGQTVILTVSHKRYDFPEPTLVIALTDELTTANFVAN